VNRADTGCAQRAVNRLLVRGKPVAAFAGTRTAEAIVPATEPDDRYPVRRSREPRDVAASGCRQTARAIG
jgi:hypothetical protein